METNKLRKSFTVSDLISPPEKQKQLLPQFHSPPVSPETLTTAEHSTATTPFDTHIRDPILYPPSSSPQAPLFAPSPQPAQHSLELLPPQTPQQIPDWPVSRARREHPFHITSLPNRSDYLLALEFRSQTRKYSRRNITLVSSVQSFNCFGTHETLEVLELCFEKNIILCRLPSHTSHKLQPCDVAVFASLKSAYREEVDQLERAGVNAIGKQHFTYLLARQEKERLHRRISRQVSLQLVYSHSIQIEYSDIYQSPLLT